MMWWDKFGFADWMFSRYVGEYWDSFYYWWYDEDKDNILKEAVENGSSLPLKRIDMKYWPDYLSKNS